MLTQYSFCLPIKLLHLHFYVSCIAAVCNKLTQMSTSVICAEIQQRLVLQLCQAQPYVCSTISDGKSCYKMEFQMSDGTFCSAGLTNVEVRTAAAVRS